MGWKDGKRPEQYLFTITDDFADDWKALKLSAKPSKTSTLTPLFVELNLVASTALGFRSTAVTRAPLEAR